MDDKENKNDVDEITIGTPKKVTRGPIFDIMTDEEIEETSGRILDMIDAADSTDNKK